MRAETPTPMTLSETPSIVVTVTAVVRALIRKTGALHVHWKALGDVLAIEIRVADTDQPKLVGAAGRNIASLTALAQAMGKRRGTEVIVDLLEPLPTVPAKGAGNTWKPMSPAAISAVLNRTTAEL